MPILNVSNTALLKNLLNKWNGSLKKKSNKELEGAKKRVNGLKED